MNEGSVHHDDQGNSDDESESESSSSDVDTGGTDNEIEIDNEIDIDIEDDQERNLLVTKISDTICSLTTSLETEYKGYDTTSSGIMFSIEPILDPIELLTIEFQANDQITSGSSSATYSERVQVYYRMGSFLDVTDDPSQWTLIADTYAHLMITSSSSSSSTAIIPVNEFESVILKEGEVYSIYIHLPMSSTSTSSSSSFMKIKPSDLDVGAISAENDTIEIQTGVSLGDDGGTAASTQLFPSSFKEAADFNGVIHYEVVQLCEDIMSIEDVSQMIFYFGINNEPTDVVLAALSDAVVETLTELLVSNDNLASDYSLEIEGTKSKFQGSKIEKCPVSYTTCSLISTTVWFKYIEAMVPNFSIIEMEILSEGKQINDTVSSYMAPVAETVYIDPPLSKFEFIITLMGVQPPETKMNDVQKRYFQDVTLQFLQEFTDDTVSSSVLSVLTVTVLDDIPQTFVEEDEERKLAFFPSFFSYHYSSNFVSRRTPTPTTINVTKSLRKGRRRRLQVKDNDIVSTTVGRTQIITEIAAEGTIQDLRSTVLASIGNNPDRYLNALITQQMRPGEINIDAEQEGNIYDGDYFSGVNGALVKINPVSSSGGGTVGSIDTGEGKPSGENGNGTSPPYSATAGGRGSIGLLVCILLIVASLLWILYRVYRDCFYSPPLRVPNLNDDGEEKKEPTMVQRLISRIPKINGLRRPSNVTTPQFSFVGVSDPKDPESVHSSYNFDDSDSGSDLESDLESCSTEEEEVELRDAVTRIRQKESESSSSKNSSSDSDSDSDSSQNEINQRSRPVAKQKVRRLPMHQVPKQNNKSPMAENGTSKKAKKNSLASEMSPKSVAFTSDSDKDLSVITNTDYTDGTGNRKLQKRPPRDPSDHGKKRGITASKSLDWTTKKRDVSSKSAHSTQSNNTRKSIDAVKKAGTAKGKKKNKTDRSANSNHTKDSKNKDFKKQSSDTGLGSRNKEKKRGIKATKSMPIGSNHTKDSRNKDISSKSTHSTQSNSTRKSIDAVKKAGTAVEKKKNKKDISVKSNHTIDSKNRDFKKQASDTGLGSRNKEKKRGIKATKSMPLGNKKKKKTVAGKKKAIPKVSIDSTLSSSLSNGSGFVAVPFDSISEVSSLSKVGKKKGKKKDDSMSSEAFKSKISKKKSVKRTYSDHSGSKKDQLETKRRGIRPSKSMDQLEIKRRGIKPSKSMPVQKKKPMTKSLSDMLHDSDSDSDDSSLFYLDTTELDDKSDVSSLSASNYPRKIDTSLPKEDIFQQFREEEDRLMSRKKDKSRKPTEGSRNKEKKRGIKATKSMPIGKLKPKKKSLNDSWVWQLSDGHRSMDSSKLDDMLSMG